MKKIGIVGVGGYGKGMLNSVLIPMAKEGKCTIAGAVIRNIAKHQEMYDNLSALGCQAFKTTTEMYEALKGELDCVIIFTGIESHMPLTLEALSYGFNVCVEKPASGSVSNVEKMIEAEQNSPKWVVVGFQHIATSSVAELKRNLLAGDYGKVTKVTVQGLWRRNDVYYNRNNWAGKVAMEDGELVYDSPANNAFAHYINLPLFLLGETFEKSTMPLEVTGDLYRARAIETFDTCSVKIKTSADIEILALFTHASNVNVDPMVKLTTTLGHVIYYNDYSFEFFNLDGESVYKSVASESRVELFGAVVDKCKDDSVFLCGLENALSHTICIEKLHQTSTAKNIAPQNFTVDKDGFYQIVDIEEIFQKCYDQHLMISDIKDLAE